MEEFRNAPALLAAESTLRDDGAILRYGRAIPRRMESLF
jgi:hypothetical protein